MSNDINTDENHSTEPEFEEEDTDTDTEGTTKPWNPSQIRVNTKTFSLRQVIDDIQDKTIDLAPDFQRDYVWRDKQKVLLIESILLGIPLPAFYFNADKENTYQVVDGVQRLSTVRDFVGGAFELSDHLEYLKDLSGRHFEGLEPPLKRRLHQTQIVVHVIEPTSPLDLKYDIFKRINTGGSPLTPQEIRHCMSRPRSRDLLAKLAKLESFRQAVKLRSVKRMEDREMVLRFIAFRRLFTSDTSFARYSDFKTLDSFLLQTTADLDSPTAATESSLKELEVEFDRAMGHAKEIFNDYAFRKWPQSSERKAPLSRALFESWAVVLASVLNPITPDQANTIRIAARKAMTDNNKYIDAISYGTGRIEQIRLRFNAAGDIVRAATGIKL